jgi:hypothetical protein
MTTSSGELRGKQNWFQSSKDNVVPLGRSGKTVLSERSSIWIEPTKIRLDDLVSKLPDNWDGYGGVAVNFLNAHFAVNMLNSICKTDTPAPSIVPGQRGDLQIEWHTNRFDIELHILGPNKVWAFLDDLQSNQLPQEIELENDFTIVTNWVKALTEAEVATKSAAA